jgi:hypothetical protein
MFTFDFMVTQKVYKLGGAMATANFDIRVEWRLYPSRETF